jgi:hypothetical protein
MEEKKLTPEGELMYRIIEQWGNAIAMPQMEGWIREYGDGRVKAQQGAVWPIYVIDKSSGDRHEVNKIVYHPENEPEPHVWCDTWYGHHVIGKDCEWYESGQSKEGSNIALIKNILLSDIDAPVFTHSPQFKKHFDYIKKKFLEIIETTNEQPIEQKENEAVFKWFFDNRRGLIHTQSIEQLTELYNEYQKQNKQGCL